MGFEGSRRKVPMKSSRYFLLKNSFVAGFKIFTRLEKNTLNAFYGKSYNRSQNVEKREFLANDE